MSLFKPAEQQQSYIKAGFYGEGGSGKTWTMSLLAIGLHKYIKSTKPVTFFDTETGSEYVLPKLFKPAAISLLSVKSRSFTDLMAALEEAKQASDILIIDSITHVWLELQEAYKKSHNIQRIEFQDWSILKPEWNRFTTEFLNSPMHIMVGGRSRDEYEFVMNDRGKKELNKTGTRMATEKNLSYEPSLLVEMEKVIEPKTGFWIPRAWVLKDRFGEIDGKCFDKPTFETFLPHISDLNLGGQHVGIDTSRSSEALFGEDTNESRYEYQKQRDIALEEIKDEIDRRWPGMTTDQKLARIDVLTAVFGTSSKTAIENMSLAELKKGLARIRSGEFDQIGQDHETNGKPKEPKKAKAA